MKFASTLKPRPMNLLGDTAEALLEIHRSGCLNSQRHLDIGELSIDDAYEVQRRVIAARLTLGEEVVGYKVGCTRPDVRSRLGANEPICGRLMAAGLLQGNAVLNGEDYANCSVEPQFVVKFGKDLPHEVGDEREIVDAIEYVSPGIEIQNDKFWFGEPTLQELVAANGLHAGLVVGAEKIRPTGRNLDVEGVGLFRNGLLVDYGIGADILGGAAQIIEVAGQSSHPPRRVSQGGPDRHSRFGRGACVGKARRSHCGKVYADRMR